MELDNRLAYTFDTAAAAVSRTRSTIVRFVGQGVINYRSGKFISSDKAFLALDESRRDGEKRVRFG